jgi:integrase
MVGPREEATHHDGQTMASRRYLVGLLPRWFLEIRKNDESRSPEHVARMLDEARSLLDVVVGHRLESLYTVAISHGIRMAEAIGAQWSYVDLAAGDAASVTSTESTNSSTTRRPRWTPHFDNKRRQQRLQAAPTTTLRR